MLSNERDLPIPEEAIERAAGINDKIEINGFWTKEACQEKDKGRYGNTSQRWWY